MDHPPIPPNCKHFDSGVHPYFILDCGDEICLITTARWRPIVAAVARCAWLDEAERIKKEFWTKDNVKICPEYNDAIINSEAWAAWGKS